MHSAPKLEEIQKGLTTIDSISEDIWGVGKIPAEDFDVVLDIGSGDGLFAKLVSKYNPKALVIKNDWRDNCLASDVMPMYIGDIPEGCDENVVYATRESIVYSDPFGHPVMHIIHTDAIAAMTLGQYVTTYAKDIPHDKLVLKLCEVPIEHIIENLAVIHDVKALIIIKGGTTSSESSFFIDGLKQIFEIVENKSSGDVHYVRCYHLCKKNATTNPKLLES